MEDWKFEKSSFKEKHISNSLNASKKLMSDEQFTKVFGQDQITAQFKTKAQELEASKIFSDKNLNKRQLIPHDDLKSKITQKYHQAFGNKEVRWITEGKRADHSKNKLKLQDHLKEEYELLIERRQEEMLQYETYVTDDEADKLAVMYNTPEKKTALREWAMGANTDNILLRLDDMELSQEMIVNNAKELISEKVEDRFRAYSRILRVVDAIDIDQFAYSTDREFASNYAKKYELLCKGTSAEVFINKFREEGGGSIDNVCLADLEVKIDMMKQYKQDYELRMQLLSSPLYALISTSDIKDYQGNRKSRSVHASQELKDYITLFEQLANSKVGKRKDITALYNEGIKLKREQLSTEYVQRAQHEIKDIEGYKDNTGAEILKSLSGKKAQEINSGFDKSDYDFMENTRINLGDEKLLGLDYEGLKALETAISDTMKNQSKNGLSKNANLLTAQDKFEKLVETRRKLLVSDKQLEYFKKYRHGLGCDFNNPNFKETTEYSVLNAIYKDKSTINRYNDDNAILKGNYQKQLSELAQELKENGYNVYEGPAEQLLIEKSYDKKPQMEENSTAALFDDALHANSMQSLKKLQNRDGSGKAGIKRFFAIFKEKYPAKCGELPDEAMAQSYTEREENHIKWFLHQLIGRDELSSKEIDDLENLWNKKQAFDQKKGEPVSDKLRKTVSDLLSAWRESLNDLEIEKEAMRSKIRQHNRTNELNKEKELKAAYDERNKNKPKVSTDKDYWQKKIKGSYKAIVKLETAPKLDLFFKAKPTNDKIRERIINHEARQERRNLYMQYSDEQREKLRSKTTYVIDQSEPDEINQRNQYGRLYMNSIRDVEKVLRTLKPEAYYKIDTIRDQNDPKERTVKLYHAEGTRLLEEEGHDVIEIDVGGSSYRELSHAQNGFLGYSEGDEYELHKQYGDKYHSHRKNKTMDYIRVKSRSGKSEKAKDRKKYRYTIAGPSPETGGLTNSGEYSIQETTYHILEIGQKHLEDIFKKWQEEDIAWEKSKQGENPADKRQKIDFLLRGHSRGAVGSVMGAMKLNYWIHNNYPQYADQVKLHLTQYDAVPGKFTNWGGYDKVDHAAKEHSVKFENASDVVQGNFTDKEFLPLGSDDVDTTMIYSMNTQYQNYFAAQEVRNAKRLIFTPFNHAVGLDADSTDASQLDQEGEKLHAMAFYDTTTGNAYRQSGLNHLPDGVYVMDEKHNLVKIGSVEEYVKIIQLTVPENELKEQAERHKCMLHAVASKFKVSDEEAEGIWKKNKTTSEVKEAAEKWKVFDAQNKVEALLDEENESMESIESEFDYKRLKKALIERRLSHTEYITKNSLTNWQEANKSGNDKNTKADSVIDFLKNCTEVNYYADYVNHDLFVYDKTEKNDAVQELTSYITKFLESAQSIDFDALSDEEKLIADTAADKVRDLINMPNPNIDIDKIVSVIKKSSADSFD
ncbi:MAG: hypothetical protein K6E91_07605 [Butyrivibrio sp.]|nr:hypothetical protein [Butyrivibrio sp.]